tara:strand:- start:25 stop:1440 length:1416 start_codon:yes stop_codon:yes gene_type:complete
MAEEPKFGAFTDILDIDTNENKVNNQDPDDALFKYGVYQLATQKPDISQEQLQKTYGTSAMPIFEWVKTIQTGERTYDPNNPDDKTKLEEFKKLGTPPGFLTPEEIERQLISDTATAVSAQIGREVGQAIGEGVESPVTSGLKSAFGFGDLPGDVIINPEFDLSAESFAKLTKANQGLKSGEYLFNPAVANERAAIASGNIDAFNALRGERDVTNIGTQDSPLFAFKSKSGNTFGKVDIETSDPTGKIITAKADLDIKGNNPATGEPYKTYSSKTIPTAEKPYWQRVKNDATSRSTVYASAGAGVTSFLTDLFLTKGKDPVKSAKKGAGTAAGTYIGLSLGGPVGAVVGATVGGTIGGRVICNELRKQGLMKTKDVTIDYKFTMQYLKPRHIKGYHFWAPEVVLGLRKGKNVKFWHHIAQHRSNEIQYIMGVRKKPDYLGKLYRHIFEPICYIIGIFAKKRDYRYLLKEKM